MPKVRFNIGKQSFDLACEEGQEERIQQLAARLNERFMKLSASFTSAPDNMVLAVTALMMEDEIESMAEQYEQQSAENEEISSESDPKALQQFVDDVVNPVAQHIEILAQRLEKL